MDYEKLYTSLLLIQAKNSVHFKLKIMPITCFRCVVDLVYFVLACKKSNLGEALLFQNNLPLLKHFVDKNR